jgi:DNA-binding SARP family transcriptional activator
VLVPLLGDIRVDGRAKPLNPKPTSVTAYLALHRAVPSDRLEEACWYGADGTSHRKRLRDVMTECRDALGSHHFPANRDGVYRIGPGVRTDLELFDWHVTRAADQDPEDAAASYRAALDLVTGRPFSYANAARRSFGWVDVEHHATTWEFKVAGVAKAFAELSLDLGRRDEALDVLHRLLQAMPLNSGLVEALMRVHLAAGDRPAADGVYQEHAKALDQARLGDPDDAVEQLRLTFTPDD